MKKVTGFKSDFDGDILNVTPPIDLITEVVGSKKNTRRERRLLRRASQRLGRRVTRLVIIYHLSYEDSVYAYDQDGFISALEPKK